jgi:hypothetical protein
MRLLLKPRSIAFRLIVAVLAVELVSSVLVVVSFVRVRAARAL